MSRIVALALQVLVSLAALTFPLQAFAQDANPALERWERLFSPLFDGKGYKVSFECITNGIGNPFGSSPRNLDCIPGHIHISAEKFSLDYGMIKMVSDGNLMIIVEEQEATMMVDSVSRYENGVGQFEDLLLDSNLFRPQDLRLDTIQFQGSSYQSIRVYDRVMDPETGQEVGVETFLLLDAEGNWKHWIEYRKEENAYTWFTIESYGYDYSILELTIYFPDTEQVHYAGYTVFDYRFLK